MLNALNVMGLATPESAILSAVIFNALIIIALIPLALRGVRYRAVGASVLLRDNLLIYGLGGIVAPFIGIKVIDMVLVGARPRLTGGDDHAPAQTRARARSSLLTVLTGVVYPLARDRHRAGRSSRAQANGSLIVAGRQGRRLGAHRPAVRRPEVLLGPARRRPRPVAYNGAASSGSNLGPLNDALVDAVQGRIDALRAADPGNTRPIPVDLVTASGSGLDPHISPAAARYQVGARGAGARPVRGDGRRRWWRGTPQAGSWASSASPSSTSWPSTSRWTQLGTKWADRHHSRLRSLESALLFACRLTHACQNTS